MIHGKSLRQGLSLGLWLLVGSLLRFWDLSERPLWTDEVLTAIFSLGKRLSDVPLDRVLSGSELRSFFQLNPDASLVSITQAVSTDSTHPPIFFFLSHLWLRTVGSWFGPVQVQDLPLLLRSFSALTSSLSLLAIYGLGRVAFRGDRGQRALLLSAWLAVSPFGVYLGQEARHYSLGVLCVIGSLAALFAILHDLRQDRPLRWPLLLGWAAVNVLGLYVHYFFVLSWLGQGLALGVWLGRNWPKSRPWLLPLGLTVAGVCLAWSPWLPTLLSHMGRDEVRWIVREDWTWLDSLLQPLMLIPGTLAMFVMLPVPDRLSGLQVLSVLSLLALAVWGGGWLWRGGRAQRDWVLAWAGLLVLATMALLVGLGWAQHSRVTSIFRYNFVFFPAVGLVATACLSGLEKRSRARVLTAFLSLGLCSSLLLVNGWVFPQPDQPATKAAEFLRRSDAPVLFARTYRNLNDVAKGMALALELQRQEPETRVMFIQNREGEAAVDRELATALQSLGTPRDIWISQSFEAAERLAGTTCQTAAKRRVRVSGEGYYHLVCP